MKKYNVIAGLNIGKIILGNALMYNAEIFSRNGIILGISMLILLGGIFAHLSLFILLKSGYMKNKRKYEDLIVSTLGNKMKYFIKIFVLFLCAFSICTYVDIVRIILRQMGLTNQIDLYVTLAIFIFINFIFVKYEYLAFVNILGLIGVVVFACISFAKSLNYGNVKNIVLAKGNIDTVDSISRISLSFCYHYCVLPFLDGINLKGPGVERNIAISVGVAGIVGTVTHIFIGTTGYIAFPKSKPLWFENITDSDPVVFYVLLITMLAITVLSVPICFIGIKLEYEPFLTKQTDCIKSRLVGSVLTCLLVLGGQILANNTFIKCLVAIITSLIMFIFPGLSFLKIADRKDLRTRKISLFCVVFGIILLLKTGFDLCYNLVLLVINA